MLESSGFRKYSTLVVFQLLYQRLCLCLCQCLCFLFLCLFVFVFAVVIVFFLHWYQYQVDGGRDAGNSRPSSQLRYRPLRCAIHWWHPSQSGFELSEQEWISSKKSRWAIAKHFEVSMYKIANFWKVHKKTVRQRPSDWVSEHQPPTLMICRYILHIACSV